MKKIPGLLCLVFFMILLGLSACSRTAPQEHEALNPIGPESELSILSSQAQIPEFFSENKEPETTYDGDECYNITPGFIAGNSDFQVFKYNKSSYSYIMYEDEIYSIGTCLGGYGITSMALADLNRDGQYELYYTFSWGSGIPRSQIGYFDPAVKEVRIFDESFYFLEIMLTVTESDGLCVNTASLNMDSFVDFSITSQDLIGTIALENDEISLRVDQEKLE